jgi:hypothetical protein
MNKVSRSTSKEERTALAKEGYSIHVLRVEERERSLVRQKVSIIDAKCAVKVEGTKVVETRPREKRVLD